LMDKIFKILRLIGIIFSIGLALYASFTATQNNIPATTALFAIAGIAFGILTFRQDAKKHFEAKKEAIPGSKFSLILPLTGFILFIISVIGFANVSADGLIPLWSWVLFLAGILVFICSFINFNSWAGKIKNLIRRIYKNPYFWILTAVIIIGAVARFYKIGEIPFGIWYDEANNGIEAQKILNGQLPVFIPNSLQLPAFLEYIFALSIKIFGPDIFSLRLVTALIGIATIPAIYFLGKEIANKPVGLAAAALLAFSRWHINFSRFGMNGILAPLFEVLLLLFLFKGMKSGNKIYFVLAGVALALGIYSYFSLWVIPIAVILIFVLFFKKGFIKKQLVGIGLFAITSLMILSPLLIYAKNNPSTFFQRTSVASYSAGKTFEQAKTALLSNIEKHLKMFHFIGDPNGRHNLSGEPMLDPLTGGLLILGLGSALVTFWRKRSILLLSLGILMLLPGILSVDFEAPQAYRSIAVVIPVFLLAAIPFEIIGKIKTGKFIKIVLLVILFGGFGYVAYDNIYTYFVKQQNDNRTFREFSAPETYIAKKMKENGNGFKVYVSDSYDQYPTIKFLTQGQESVKIQDNNVFPLTEGKLSSVFLNHFQGQLFDLAKQLYPNAKFEQFKDKIGKTLIYYIEVPKTDIEATKGLICKDSADEESSFEGVFDLVSKNLSCEGYIKLDKPSALTISQNISGLKINGLDLGGEAIPAGVSRIEFDVIRNNNETFIKTDSLSNYFKPNLPLGYGLLGIYQNNGQIVLKRIDTIIDFIFHEPGIARPFSVNWTGYLTIEDVGKYTIKLQTSAKNRVVVDDHDMVEPIFLEKGKHKIEVAYDGTQTSVELELFWKKDNGEFVYIPFSGLSP